MSVKVKEADWGAVASTAATGVLLERRRAIGGENVSSAWLEPLFDLTLSFPEPAPGQEMLVALAAR